MVYFDNILEFLGAAQFEAFSLRFNLCFGTSTRDLASLFRLPGTIVGDGSSEDCKSSILIQNSKNPFKQLDLGDELPFIEIAMGYNHILQVKDATTLDGIIWSLMGTHWSVTCGFEIKPLGIDCRKCPKKYPPLPIEVVHSPSHRHFMLIRRMNT